MKQPSVRMISLHLERKEAAACQAFMRASEQAEARIIAAMEGLRPLREKLEQARLDRAAFIAGQAIPAAESAMPEPESEQVSANLSLSALARSLNTQTSAAPEKHLLVLVEPHKTPA